MKQYWLARTLEHPELRLDVVRASFEFLDGVLLVDLEEILRSLIAIRQESNPRMAARSTVEFKSLLKKQQ